MQVGALFPQTELGGDAGAVRAWAEAVDGLGYRHVQAYEHVLGADTTSRAGWPGPYDLHDTFHEPLVLFAWLAAFTSLEFATGILVAPQRQTALLAKQAAEVDLLAGAGRLRLGLGIGWNQVEFDALGQSFDDRADRLEEQIDLLRRLWTEESVTIHGRYHHIDAAGIAPRPDGPIPVWLGAHAPAALRRVGRLADGWFPQARPGGGLEEAWGIVAEAATEAGRDPAVIGVEGQVVWTPQDPERVATHAERWRSAGATHLAVNTMGTGCRTIDDHVAALADVAAAIGL